MTNERWVVAAKRADFTGIGRRFRIDPVTARIIRNRDIVGEEAIREYLCGGIGELHSARLLKDMDRAVEIIRRAADSKKKIRIIGDYDIDGVMSTYILREGFLRIGADVDICIPDRVKDGYGLHEPLIRRAKEEGISLIVTCDNGIAAASEIALAKELGMKVVVTDHHSVPYEERGEERIPILPPADAVVNPKREDCPYPFKGLCGAAVAYKLVTVLYAECGVPSAEHERFIELVAIATVGDVMDLLGENRIFVKEGLRRLSANPFNPGIRALINACDLCDRPITAYHIGFVLGPCINAGGRLDTAMRALELLSAGSVKDAAKLAGDLQALNTSRKALTDEGVAAAVEMVETTGLGDDRVLVIYLPECHESLAGIIAGRLRERYHKPSFVLTRSGDYVKGSGRSIETYSMYDELTGCRDLLVQFGGHPMAAGLTMEEKNVDTLRSRLNSQCALTETDLAPKVTIDVAMPLSYLTMELVEEWEILEPYGKGNPKPLFAQRNVRVSDMRVLGRRRNVVQMRIWDDVGNPRDAVWFGDGDAFMRDIAGKESIDIVYSPQIHIWRENRSIRIVIQNYR